MGGIVLLTVWTTPGWTVAWLGTLEMACRPIPTNRQGVVSKRRKGRRPFPSPFRGLGERPIDEPSAESWPGTAHAGSSSRRTDRLEVNLALGLGSLARNSKEARRCPQTGTTWVDKHKLVLVPNYRDGKL